MNLRSALVVFPFILMSLLSIGFAQQVEPQSPQRTLAPGVLKVVPPDPHYRETLTGPAAMVEIVQGMPGLAGTPNFAPITRTVYDRAKRITLRREIWNLEFAFKPLRMVEVDIPQPSGKMQRKLVWYMVYRVVYRGNDLQPTAVEDEFQQKTYRADEIARDGRFFIPSALLVGNDFKKAYPDRLIPAAKKVIANRERVSGKLYNSVEISSVKIPLSTDRADQAVWGFFTWEDVDPRIDYLSLFIGGLTNAYIPSDPPEVFKEGDAPGTGRNFLSKQLRLNFWRPGDSIDEHEGEIKFGVPIDNDPAKQAQILDAFGLKERVDFEWVYR